MAMDALSRCRACGVTPNVVARRRASGGDNYYRQTHECDGPLCETEEAARAEWNAANTAPAPALRALAKLGAWRAITEGNEVTG